MKEFLLKTKNVNIEIKGHMHQ